LNKELSVIGKQVITPDEKQFVSAIVQAHRKGEKAFHVKAFRGSKEGYLFFLAPGILWTFKKPLGFFSHGLIQSISYTSVLQRTFNLNITVNDEKQQEIEFSMLDQADFGGIDEYVKRHGLNDASLAASRKAKMYNVNKPKGEPDTGGTDSANAEGAGVENGGEELTELQKAEQALQDAEDEEEEDFALESGEGDSDGSGQSGDEEEYEEGVGSEEMEGEEGDEEMPKEDEEVEKVEAPTPAVKSKSSRGFSAANAPRSKTTDADRNGYDEDDYL